MSSPIHSDRYWGVAYIVIAPLACTGTLRLSMLSANLTDYHVLGLVGQGQFAQVYCAVHRYTGQIIAIKQTRHVREQASQEAFILPKLDHPNIVDCYGIVRTDHNYRFALEYCESGTLRNYLDAFCPMPLAQAKSLLIHILSGLSHIHDKAIVHGDLKPENILLTIGAKGLVAKLSDFGSAQLHASAANQGSQSSLEIGSPTYAAPERFEGQVSYATDLYSIGVILYEMLLGDRPFSGPPQALRHAHTHTPVPHPKQLSAPAIQLLTTALHKDPHQRFGSATAMLSAVQRLSTLYSSDVSPSRETSREASTAHTRSPAKHAIAPLQAAHSIEELISTAKGCCIKTASAFYLLTPQHQLSHIAALQPHTQVAVAPEGQWVLSLNEQLNESEHHHQTGNFSTLSHEENIKSHPARSVVFKISPSLPTNFKVRQVLALNNRYLLRVKTLCQANETTKPGTTTVLEGFTRRAQFVGQLIVNLPLHHVALTQMPYQLIACANAENSAQAAAVIITLKPFQIRYLSCPSPPHCACATPWGYVVVCQNTILFFDRSNNLIKTIEDLPVISTGVCAIASLSPQQLLLATPQSNQSSLHVLNLDQLELDIIF
ncbi:MAG: serine/threonine-protein kinase [Phormidesmis sp.]